MRYGFVMPHGDARTIAEMAWEAEQTGWDGIFVWESIYGVDAWVALTAAAMRTERIKLGTMLTPPSRMRPWKLASEAATLDNLSGGRVILAVGLGALETGFAEFGEVTDRKTRAELMDEALDIMTGLWQGQPFSYNGKHYQVKPSTFLVQPDPPVQKPRIPIWVVGAYPSEKSMGRVMRYDGLLPQVIDKDNPTPLVPTSFARQANPDELPAMMEYIRTHRKETTPFDLICEGTTPGDDPVRAAAIVRAWADAGATWYNEAMWEAPQGAEGIRQVRERIRQGPPRI
jgi:hypothetical protein